MGLDMYLNRVDKEGNVGEIATWRKHPDLHCYIEGLWRNQGGTGDFNCVPFKLTEEQILEIIKKSKEKSFDKGAGFFFGESTEEDYNSTIDAMEKALASLKNGYTIVYDSWW